MALDFEQQQMDHETRCRTVYARLFQRTPRPEEFEEVVSYAKEFGWANAIRVLINSNEFMFVE